MDIQGTYTLSALPPEVWQHLLDTQILRHTIPGIEHLEQVSENIYAITITLKRAPLEGTYRGYVTLSEQDYPYHYRLSFVSEGEHGTINGNGIVHLNERYGTTIVNYKGVLTYTIQGMLVSSKLAKGAAKLLIQQFFASLATQLPAKEHGRVVNTECLGKMPGNGRVRGKIIFPFSRITATPAAKSLFSKIIHRSGLGRDDEQEQHMEQLLRNGGMLLGFLLLVWIGARLPRRKQG